MKAVFLYDGSLKAFNKDNSLTVIQDAETVVKVKDDMWIVDNEVRKSPDDKTIDELPVKAIKACEHGNVLWIYGTDKNLYRDKNIIYVNDHNYEIALNPDGVACGFIFFNPDGSLEVADDNFGFLISNKIVKVTKNDTEKILKLFGKSEWFDFDKGLYADWYQYDSLITENKIIWTMGATLNSATGEIKKPKYSVPLNKFVEGNAFVDYFVKYTHQRWQPIGYIENIGYFFRPKTGQVFKYDIENDNLIPWVELVPGSGSDHISINNNMIEKTGCILVDSEIIYFDGSKIMRINIDTGEKHEVAEATEFYGIPI